MSTPVPMYLSKKALKISTQQSLRCNFVGDLNEISREQRGNLLARLSAEKFALRLATPHKLLTKDDAEKVCELRNLYVLCGKYRLVNLFQYQL